MKKPTFRAGLVPFGPDRVIAAMVFFSMAAWEARFDLGGIARAGFTAAVNFVGWFVIPIWVVCGIVLLLSRSIPWRPHIVSVGIVAAIMHGAFLRVGRATAVGPSGGALFIAAAFLLLLLMGPTMRDWLAARGLVSPNPRNPPPFRNVREVGL